MPQFRVTFMNHIVETYVVEAESLDAAWRLDPGDVEGRAPESWDSTSCEVTGVERAEDGVPRGPLLVVRSAE